MATSYKHTSDMKTNLTKTKLGECSGGQGREDGRSYSGGETVILTLSMIYLKSKGLKLCFVHIDSVCKVKVYISTVYIPYILMLEMAWLGRSMSSIEMKWNIKHWHYNLYNGSHRLPCNTQLVLGWNLKILLETGFHSIWFQANQFKVWHPGARPAGHKRGVRKLT